ncbi:DUF3466 family protein [uncultured Tolumonas sp.]|uniref:DUF3466 family protein n=1 Tax=uncultured Tolumonas sp. TaxID=263765 RepID=UPI00292D36B3|nr:DUF3466 family protein [uncultured Tolumonas sp.]
MKMTKIAAILPLLMAGAVSAAAQDPFYSISEVVSAANIGSANYGPWALSISGDGTEISSLAVKSDWYHYFHMSPSGMDLAHRFNYENGCTALLSSTTCKSYLETSNWAATWFSDLSSNVDQTFNVTSSAVTAESAGIVTKYGSDTTAVTSVGYMSLASHSREAVATLPSATTYLSSVGGTGYAFASAYDIVPVGSNYLVVGTAGAQKATAYSYCYNGNSEVQTYSSYCPGYETQTAFWLVNASGTLNTSLLANSHNTSTSTNFPYTASAMGAAKVGSEYIAVGYSATVGYGIGSTSSLPKNVAAFWKLGDGSLSTTPTTSLVFANDSDNPGTNSDYTIDNSWAVGVNSNGYIVGNRTFRAKESRNYPTKMFIAKYSSSSDAISSTTTPITTSGVNSEAAAVNNADQVVGWTDERSVTSQPVFGSVSRLQEAFIYNINTGNRYALNDLICGLDSAGAKSCMHNGKYYYIEYANGITDDGAIVASARRFDSYTDWSTLSNGTNVVVKLSVSSTTAFDSNHDVPAGYVVANQLPVFDFGASDSSGGGSFGIFGLLAMAGAAVVGQYRRFVKKGS